MNGVGFLAILGLSIVGSPHCAGMCGGFVAFYSAQAHGRVLPHVFYNAGRLATYVLLGAAAGYLGGAVNDLGLLIGIQRLVATIIGIIMIFSGVQMLFAVRLPGATMQTALWKKLFAPAARLLKAGNAMPPVLLAGALGLLSTFLPCGFLYAFVAMAAGTADPAKGALIMACFWMGTVPIMAALGGAVALLSERALRHVPRVTAILILAAGVASLSGHLDAAPQQPGTAPSCPHHQAADQ